VSAAQVLVIGDNLLAGTNSVGAELDALAQSAGVLQADQHFADDSSASNDALAYMGQGILAQYTAGNPNGDVRLVVMTGGGVDAVFGTCEQTNDQCPVLASAAAAAQALLQQMANDGVEQVVYLFYPDPDDTGQKARLDVLRSMIEPICEQSAVPCYLLDLRPVFAGHYSEYVVPAGLTVQGATAIANATWDSMGQCLTP
jgi:hypothetical protein